jgi:ribosomal protein S18 acetylase RimI-like enzyme
MDRMCEMADQFERYQIRVVQLQLPERELQPDLTVCCLSTKVEYNRVLNLFLKIFPNEIDTQKADELQELPVSGYEGNFLAKIGDMIIGFLISGIINHVGYIAYLGVEEAYRSSGVATALLQQFQAYLKERDVEKIRCTIRKDNQKTLGYIKYLGFELL